MKNSNLNYIAILIATISILLNLQAANAESKDSILIELNKLENKKQNCLVTFVVSSQFKTAINELAYEVVLFDTNQKVDLMTVFDFQEIGIGKTRVRQFQLPNKDCSSISKLLINDVSKCHGPSIPPSNCSNNLIISNKTKIEFLN